MKHMRKGQIIVETERLMTVSRGRSISAFCDICGREVEMISPERAASANRVSQRTIFRRIEDGSLHFAETKDGTMFICTNSVRALFVME